MNISFYKIADISNKITKRLPDNAPLTLTGVLKDNCDLLNPVIMIENSGVPDFNYAYIPQFSRYYFMSPAVAVTNNMWEIKLHVDVLYTYRQAILSAPCIVAKSSSDYNLYLNDSNYKCYQNPHIFDQVFPSGFDVSNAHFIMSVFGDKVAAT